MIHLFINALAASAGGGLTYIRNVVPLVARDPRIKLTVALSRSLRDELQGFSNVDFVEAEIPPLRRFWYEQTNLPQIIRRSGADVLLSAGNFALRKSPVPQILLSRNSLYTSPDFLRDLRSRHKYGTWLDTHLRGYLAKKSIHWADVTVAPSEAFAAELRRWSGGSVRAIHHGFDREVFTHGQPLEPGIGEQLMKAEGALKLLFVSHYNYYRNFETLIRALPMLRSRLPERRIRLLLTCKLQEGANPGAYSAQGAASLVENLAVSDMVIELGSIPYAQLHHLYRRADIYVTPAYAETFAHPLVEAMASGLPVVASDLAVHREICGDAARYFPRFSPEVLAESVVQIASSPETSKRLADAGLARSEQFSWKRHVEAILELARTLIERNKTQG